MLVPACTGDAVGILLRLHLSPSLGACRRVITCPRSSSIRRSGRSRRRASFGTYLASNVALALERPPALKGDRTRPPAPLVQTTLREHAHSRHHRSQTASESVGGGGDVPRASPAAPRGKHTRSAYSRTAVEWVGMGCSVYSVVISLWWGLLLCTTAVMSHRDEI